MCSRSSTRLSLPWPSSRGRLLARRSALGWIPHSSRPLLLVRALPSPRLRFAVNPPPRPLPLLLPPLSALLALSPWPVTPLPPLRPHPRPVPRVRHPRLLPCLVPRTPPLSWPPTPVVWPLLPPFPRGRRPNALPPPFPSPSALRLMPVVPGVLPLPVPRAPATRWAGPLAGSTSPGTPPLFGRTPTPFLLPTPLSNTPPPFLLPLWILSKPAMSAPGTPGAPPIIASTSAGPTFRPSLLTRSLFLAVLCSCPPFFQSATFATICSFGPTPYLRYLVPTYHAPYHPPP